MACGHPKISGWKVCGRTFGPYLQKTEGLKEGTEMEPGPAYDTVGNNAINAIGLKIN